MRVLVTGGAGFIGSHVVDALVEAGDEVTVLDAVLPAVHRTKPEVNDGAELIVADVTDPVRVEAALDGVDAVCHQAAMVGPGVDLDDLPAYATNNDLGTAVLLSAMARRGVRRLVLASSMVVYGEGGYRCPTDGPVPVITGAYRAGDVRHIAASSAHARDLLGYRPQVAFSDGMAGFARDPLRG